MWANGHVPVRLAEHGMTIESVQAMLRRRIDAAAPLQKGMEAPRVQCNLNHDRWEKMPDGTEQERYHAPHCDAKPWTWAPDDPFVVVAFFRPRKPVKVRQIKIKGNFVGVTEDSRFIEHRLSGVHDDSVVVQQNKDTPVVRFHLKGEVNSARWAGHSHHLPG